MTRGPTELGGQDLLAEALEALKADPVRMLARIQKVEARLAAAERQLGILAGHTHAYNIPYFDTTVQYGQLLLLPEKYKTAHIRLNQGNSDDWKIEFTTGPQPMQER